MTDFSKEAQALVARITSVPMNGDAQLAEALARRMHAAGHAADGKGGGDRAGLSG